MSECITECRTARFSLFKAGIDKPDSQIPYKQGNVKDVCQWMKSARMKELTLALRNLQSEKEQRVFKTRKLPFVTWSGMFSYRKADGLIRHSGLQCFDLDHLGQQEQLLEARQKLLEDPYFCTEMLFTSPRGNGLKWIIHIDLSRGTHETWYRAVCNYLKERYGLEADPLPGNVASACFLCYDEQLFVNPFTSSL